MRDQAMPSMADAVRYVPGIVTAQGGVTRLSSVAIALPEIFM